MGYVTWIDLIITVGSLLGFILLIYLILLVKNINISVKVFRDLMKSNRDNLNETIKHLPAISSNIAEISETAKVELKALETSVQSLDEIVKTSADAIHTIKDGVLGKLKGIIEFIDIIIRILMKPSDSEKK